MRRADPFDLSIDPKGKYSELLIKKPEYEELVTFSENKSEPVYNWFYYKEGYARDLVFDLIKHSGIPEKSLVLDPFCGTGTTLLAANQMGMDSVGFDVSPLPVFVSNTKLQQGYDIELLREKVSEISAYKFGETRLKWADPGFIDVKRAFSRYARNDILFFKEKILAIEDEKVRNFLMLGLLSIVSEASNTKKDGGVVRIVQKRHLAPVRYLLKNRLKRMAKDVKNMEARACRGEAHLGDARSIPLEESSVDCAITSPPYLNYIDYTKLYGLELALLAESRDEIEQYRRMTLRSHIGAEYRKAANLKSESLKETLENVREIQVTGKLPQIVEGYFEDMYMNIESTYRCLKDGARYYIVVANSCLPEITIDVDVILAELGEQVGFTAESIWVAKARWCEVRGIRKERPVRESIIILRK